MSKFEKVIIWAEHHNGYHTKTYKEKTQYIPIIKDFSIEGAVVPGQMPMHNSALYWKVFTYYIVLDLHTFVEKKPFLV